eukprot:1324547-Rhodomonas_salina.1
MTSRECVPATVCPVLTYSVPCYQLPDTDAREDWSAPYLPTRIALYPCGATKGSTEWAYGATKGSTEWACGATDSSTECGYGATDSSTECGYDATEYSTGCEYGATDSSIECGYGATSENDPCHDLGHIPDQESLQ